MLAAELGNNPSDVPFALLYVANTEGTQVVLKQTVGLNENTATNFFHLTWLI